MLVTILVLVETSLQLHHILLQHQKKNRHNPCFSGNLFTMADSLILYRLVIRSQSLFQWKPLYNEFNGEEHTIGKMVTILVLVETSLQCQVETLKAQNQKCHNPCFSGNLFTMKIMVEEKDEYITSQSLFQWKPLYNKVIGCRMQMDKESQSLFQWKPLYNSLKIFLFWVITCSEACDFILSCGD